MRLKALSLIALASIVSTSPAYAALPGQRLSVGSIFGDAAAPVQLIILILAAAIIAAPVLLALRRPAALNALAKGAPLLAGAASLFTLLAGAVGIANSPVVPSLTVLAPGLAEMLLLMVLGLLATFSAVVCRELAGPNRKPFAAAE